MDIELELNNIYNSIELSQNQIEVMLHALGLIKNGELIQSNRRYNPLICSTRNHFQIEQDDDWDVLVSHGFAGKRIAMEFPYYFVTQLGIYCLQDILNFKFNINKE